MAFKVPHALAMEEAQGPQEAIVDCVTRENAARISCSFQFSVLIKFLCSFAVFHRPQYDHFPYSHDLTL